MLRLLFTIGLTTLFTGHVLACDAELPTARNEMFAAPVIFDGRILDIQRYEPRRSLLQWAQRSETPSHDTDANFPTDRGCRIRMEVTQSWRGRVVGEVNVFTHVENGVCQTQFDSNGDGSVFVMADRDSSGRIFISADRHCPGRSNPPDAIRQAAQRGRSQ